MNADRVNVTPFRAALAGLLLMIATAWPSIAPAKAIDPGSIKRLVVVGDSITAGVGATAGHRYSTALTERLRAEHPEITEINLGHSGRALCRYGDDYAETVLAKTPDAVVIQWGVNDQYWGYSVTQFAIAYDRLVSALRRARPEMPIVTTTLVADFRYRECFDRWIGQANVAIQEIAARHGCRVAYVHQAVGHDRKAHYADIIHPNDAGARAMAEAILAAFHEAPLDKTNLAVRFDHGEEARFAQYVFIPQRADDAPHWTEVTAITTGGMTVRTELPLAVRTAPVYPKGAYRIDITDAAGKPVASTRVDVGTWQKILPFRIDPGDRPQPLTVTIARVKD